VVQGSIRLPYLWKGNLANPREESFTDHCPSRTIEYKDSDEVLPCILLSVDLVPRTVVGT